MHEMQPPEEWRLVLHPVREPGSDEIEYEEPHHHLRPEGPVRHSASNPTPFATDHSDARSSRKASAKLTTIVVPVKKKFTSACDHLS